MTTNNLPQGVWTVALAPMTNADNLPDPEATASDFYTALDKLLAMSFDIKGNQLHNYQFFFNCDTPQGAEIDGYFDLTPTFDYARHNYSAKGRITASQFCKMALKDTFATIQGEHVSMSCIPISQFANC